MILISNGVGHIADWAIIGGGAFGNYCIFELEDLSGLLGTETPLLKLRKVI
jgi:hypothetical protein